MTSSVVPNHPQRPTLRAGLETRPTPDQMYLADRICQTAPQARLTPAALQKLNSEFGVRIVSDALRYVRGFPPAELRSPYPYVRRICQRQLEEWNG